MKTMKKLASLLFSLVLVSSLFAMPLAAFAAEGSTTTGTEFVFDERGLFSSSELQDLESQAAELAEKYNMGVYLLTTSKMNGLSDPTSQQRTDYAVNYYKEHGLGLNKGSNAYGDGIMLVIAADSRDYVTIAYGQGSYSFSDKGIEVLEDAVTDKLHDNNWYGAGKAYYKEVGRQLEYYAAKGKPMVPLGLWDWIIRLAIVLGIPLLATIFIVGKWKRDMQTAVEKSEAGNYLDPNSVVLTRSNDQFVNTTLIATPRPKSNDSGGGGGWGGGGGGGFSSSGGGKF